MGKTSARGYTRFILGPSDRGDAAARTPLHYPENRGVVVISSGGGGDVHHARVFPIVSTRFLESAEPFPSNT